MNTNQRKARKMDALGSSLKRMTDRVSEGSFATRANRTRGLQAIARELRKMGYELPAATSLKPKHVTALIRHWKERGIQDPTIRNRLGWVRWWAEHINKRSLLPRSNDNFGLAKRSRYSGNRARRADPELLDKIRDPRIRLALTLKAAFGLRREEALKFRPSASDRGDYLALVPSTTKGGRYREIPIVHPKQRKLLEEVRRLAGSGSLIPDGVSYRTYLQRYKSETRRAGIGRAHGLRHGYAQWRYLVLAGWRCPAAGGPTVEFMTARDAARDRAARLQIARELGHGRLDVTDTYLGRRYAAHVRLAAG